MSAGAGTGDPTAALAARGATKRYGDQPALHTISLELRVLGGRPRDPADLAGRSDRVAAAWRKHSGEDRGQRRLPGPVRLDDRGELTRAFDGLARLAVRRFA